MKTICIAALAWVAACGGGPRPEAPAPSPSPEPAAADDERLWLALRVQAKVDEQRSGLRQGDWLRSGDGVELVVATNRDAFVFVYYIDSDGDAEVLYPSKDVGAVRLKGDVQTRLPSRGWFRLDDVPGEETLVVVATVAPLEEADTAVMEAIDEVRRDGRLAGTDGGPSPCDVTEDATEDEAANEAEDETDEPRRGVTVEIVGKNVHRTYADTADPEQQVTELLDEPKKRVQRPRRREEQPDDNVYASRRRARGIPGARARGFEHVIDEGEQNAVLLEADDANVIVRSFWLCHAPRDDGL